MQDIVLISIPESTIRNIVEQAVRKALSENTSSPTPSTEGKQLLTRKEAAELAKVCIATIDNKVNAGVLKKYRTGGIVRFRHQEVLDAFSQSLFDNGKRVATTRSKKS
ncbi:MAG: helix-turn-helix domain-containing protein [Saprospiraceae bacterium]|nr:helix-turn-helix domain-containing protein [Saprospiraceae bacterium]